MRKEIQNDIALRENEVSVPKLYDRLCEKHDKIESVQSLCIEKMDKYMSEIAKLNQTIQEKEKLILNLKLEVSQLRNINSPPVIQIKDHISQNRQINPAESHPSYACVAKQDIKRDNPMTHKQSVTMQTNKPDTESKQSVTLQPNKQHSNAVPSKQSFTAFRGERNPLSNHFTFKFRPHNELLRTP